MIYILPESTKSRRMDEISTRLACIGEAVIYRDEEYYSSAADASPQMIGRSSARDHGCFASILAL